MCYVTIFFNIFSLSTIAASELFFPSPSKRIISGGKYSTFSLHFRLSEAHLIYVSATSSVVTGNLFENSNSKSLSVSSLFFFSFDLQLFSLYENSHLICDKGDCLFKARSRFD